MIVADASVLIALININAFEILKSFIDNIVITREVYNEVAQREYAKRLIDREIEASYISIKAYKNIRRFEEMCFVLDAGESSSILLAMEENLPLIIDEKKGRKFAKQKGVKVIGLVGILRFLYLEESLDRKKIQEIVERLRDSDFRISQTLLEMILA